MEEVNAHKKHRFFHPDYNRRRRDRTGLCRNMRLAGSRKKIRFTADGEFHPALKQLQI